MAYLNFPEIVQEQLNEIPAFQLAVYVGLH